jgi:hypothetical protein
VGWLVTTLPMADVQAAASAVGPWRYKVKDKSGSDQLGEVPQNYFAALLESASNFRPGQK